MESILPATITDDSGISVILPAYNEEQQIGEMLRETHGALASLEVPFEIVVVDDGSTDNTAEILQRTAEELDGVLAVILPENQGKGNALNRGFQASRYALTCFIDADLDLHPRQVETLLGEMQKTGADIVIGSKRHPESVLAYPWYRKLFSTVYYLMVLILFRLPVRDTQTGIKLFKREVLARSFPRIVGKKYTLDLELLVVANRLGYSIAEAPITLTYQAKFGRIGWVDIRNIVTDTMAVFYRLHVLHYYASPLLPTITKEPRVSIIVVTCEFAGVWDRIVNWAHELNYGNYEIMVVTNRAIGNGFDDPCIRVIQSGAVSVVEMKNMAARMSSSETLAFIDQDSIPDVDWLRNATPYFEDEMVAAVCGPAIAPGVGSRKQIAAGLVFSSSMVSGTASFRYTRHAMRDVDDYPSSNFIVRRSDFLGVGGFPEAFYPGEDTILCLKLTRDAEKRILYVPNVFVFQNRKPLYGEHLKQVYAYARNRGRFVRKYPETSRRLAYFMPSIFVLLLLAGFCLSFFFQVALYSYIVFIAAYLLAAAFVSVKTLDLAINFLIFPGVICTNIVYGVGFMRGLTSRSPSEQPLANCG